MIVVAEGPTAAGKTTWCGRHYPDQTVAEYLPTGHEPAGAPSSVQATFWNAVNCSRWRQAVELELSTGLAVCDGDPLKLHYSWSMAVIGELAWERWHDEVSVCRAAVAAGTIGFADLVLIDVPDHEELRRRRDQDPSRRRRHFALHAQLAEPLRRWYQTLDRLQPAGSSGAWHRMAFQTPPLRPGLSGPSSGSSTCWYGSFRR